MVLPSEEEFQPRVRVVRNRQGRIISFQDPDLGARFITRTEAIKRLNFSVERNAVVDSFGQEVGIGGLALPNRGYSVAFKVKEALYKPLDVDPRQFRPGANQEVIERTIYIDRDGRLITREISHGSGRSYDPAKYGGRWRANAAEALGVEPGKRLPTKDLKRAQYYQEFIVKTISG